MFEFVVYVTIVVWLIAYIVYEKSLQKKVRSLEKEMSELNKLKTVNEAISINEPCLENRIITLQYQARNLKFCFRCPLYRDKVQQDTQQ